MPETTTDLRGLDLLDAAIGHIEQHPETWDQGSYRCDSGMCLAGWIGELAGGEWIEPVGDRYSEWMVAEPGDPEDYVNGKAAIHVAERAERLIGRSRYIVVDDDECDLFAGWNSLAEIKAMRDSLRAAVTL
jgi:hypothetical protein